MLSKISVVVWRNSHTNIVEDKQSYERVRANGGNLRKEYAAFLVIGGVTFLAMWASVLAFEHGPLR